MSIFEAKRYYNSLEVETVFHSSDWHWLFVTGGQATACTVAPTATTFINVELSLKGVLRTGLGKKEQMIR